MRIISATIGAALVASLALAGCERRTTTETQPELAQSYVDAGSGVPNPMPGSPIGGDAGLTPGPISPLSPTVPTPTEPAPGTPRSPGSPSTPGVNPSPSPTPTTTP